MGAGNEKRDCAAAPEKSALVAMSGGVDSSVTAFLLKGQGYDLIGATMKLYDNGDIGVPAEKGCCTVADTEDARSVADRLGFPYYVLNCREEFEKQVIDRFIAAYEQGETPNPCIDCNRYMKFSLLYRRAQELKLHHVATGHYARIEWENGRYHLKKAADSTKDQSYVLYSLTQEQLAHTVFPLGWYTKAQVREIAAENGFINAKKRDSQDICFVPDGDYAAFIRRRTGREYPAGDFVDRNGQVLGTHKGIIRYTIGQRRGLGLALPRPMYVAEKDVERNRVVLSENEALFRHEMLVREINWIGPDRPERDLRACVKIRYSHKEQPARLIPEGEDTIRVIFDQPQRAITRGQAAVFYDGDEVLGGGVICRSGGED